MDPGSASLAVGMWVFILFASGLWSTRHVESQVTLDAWGQTVLRRSLSTTWALWASLGMVHILWFWCSDFGLDTRVLVPVALFLSTRFLRSEGAVWVTVSLTLLLVGWALPACLSIAALQAAVVLGLRALRQPTRDPEVDPPQSTAPYRTRDFRAPPQRAIPRVTFGCASREAMLRLLPGSVFASYVSIWTWGWRGGPFPEHAFVLNVVLSLLVFLFVVKLRRAAPLAALGATFFHAAVQTRLVTVPSGSIEWGLAAVGLGFALLLSSLAASVRMRRWGSADDSRAPEQ